MALFNLLGGGITFGSASRTGLNPAGFLGPLAESVYKKGLYKYPIDLGGPDKGHFILINVNEQIKTAYGGESVSGASPTVITDRAYLSSTSGNYDTSASAANALQLGGDFIDEYNNTRVGQALNSAAGSFGNFIVENTGAVGQEAKKLGTSAVNVLQSLAKNIDSKIGVRTIRRITDSIALYMPDNLNFSYNQGYSGLQPGGTLSQTALSALNSATDTYKSSGNKFDTSAMTQNLSPFLLNYLAGKFGPTGQILFTAGTGGMVQNPMLELMYSSPEFRTFNFDFLMFPRSEAEALQVLNIIDLLRFHQAPELVRGSGGYFLYPPSEFDISFYYNGQINPNIPQISTCVLTSIDTDYAPGGFATYEVPGQTTSTPGGTGMPVSIKMRLSFKETEYLVKGSPLLPNIRNNKNINVGYVSDAEQIAQSELEVKGRY
jgi:hypothetical protein